MAVLMRNVPQHSGELVDECRLTREHMLSAMRALEAALAKPAPSGETAWNRHVLQALGALEDAMLRQVAELENEDFTLAAIGRDQPRLLPRIEQLRQQYGDLVRQIHSLHDQLSADDLPQTGETRQKLACLLTAIRHFQAKETDLVFDALAVDIGAPD